ncbi:MAG: hypothetical protein JHC98_04795 [Thermoleophilaceae bacterium]|nr:hypothetical protein [Thermoleophilaceae bacterium]
MSNKSSKYGNPAKAAAATYEPAVRPLSFATVVLAVAGVLNLIEAAAAFGGDSRFDVNRIFLESLTGWGVAVLIIGLLQLYAAREIHLRKPSGLLWGIGLSCLSGISHFMMIGAYPLWAITVMLVNFAVIFALTTNDDAF